MLDGYSNTIDDWLAVDPHLSAITILDRLSAIAPEKFTSQQRRTVQRVLRTWRGKAARALLDNSAEAIRPRLLIADLPPTAISDQVAHAGNMTT